jgi:ABC-2 type transport system permease protein
VENPEILAILEGLPPALVAAFNLEAFNLTTPTGFFGAMFGYFVLLVSISAAMWGSDIISKEERDRTVEFALTLPVTRSKVVTAKILAALVNCIALLLITWIASLVTMMPYEPDSEFYTFLSLSMLALFLVQMIFLAVGVLLGCAMKQYKRASAVAVSLLLATYFVSVISELSEHLEFLKYFSPFAYFDPGVLLRESRLELGYVGLSVGIIAACLVGAYLTYSRRDLYI